MTKACNQQILRSASTQYGKNSHLHLFGLSRDYRRHMQSAKTLIRLPMCRLICIFTGCISLFVGFVLHWLIYLLTLKLPITTAAEDNFHILLLLFFHFSEKISLHISCESFSKQRIHMKCQDLFSLKKK